MAKQDVWFKANIGEVFGLTFKNNPSRLEPIKGYNVVLSDIPFIPRKEIERAYSQIPKATSEVYADGLIDMELVVRLGWAHDDFKLDSIRDQKVTYHPQTVGYRMKNVAGKTVSLLGKTIKAGETVI